MAHFDPQQREAEALAEMAATRVARVPALVLVGCFLALLAGAPALELAEALRGRSAVWSALPAVAGGPLDRARAAIAEIEDRFDLRSALVRWLRPPAQEALFSALGYGNERVYPGRHGWLFFRPDFDHLTSAVEHRAGTGDPIAETLAWRAELAARGIALVVLPAPVKLAVEPAEFVARAPAPPLRPGAESEWLDALARAGVEVFDPLERLARPVRAGRSTYLVHDTHWRPEAMDDVARALAVALRAVVELPAGDPDRFVERALPVTGAGDLTRLLGLPDDSGHPGRETVTIRPVTRADGTAWRPVRGAPVLVLGDSFTAVFAQPDLGWGAGAGLAERLSLHLGLPVDRLTRNAGGASASREELAAALARDPGRLDGVRVVVWQLAAREITQGDWRRVELGAPGRQAEIETAP
jgi:hypothetical protein